MTERLPRTLGPRAKRALLRAAAGERVRVLMTVAPGVDDAMLAEQVAALDGESGPRHPGTGLVTAEVPAERLAELATLKGVAHVEAAERYAD